jgi:hypothetical protein
VFYADSRFKRRVYFVETACFPKGQQAAARSLEQLLVLNAFYGVNIPAAVFQHC